MDDQKIPVLEVKDIVKRFGGLVAVNKVSMEVAPGEVVGLSEIMEQGNQL